VSNLRLVPAALHLDLALKHRVRPISAGVAVPVLAFFASGVSRADAGGLGAGLVDPLGSGLVVALVVGKTVGVFGATSGSHAPSSHPSWWDVLGLSTLLWVPRTLSWPLISAFVDGRPASQSQPQAAQHARSPSLFDSHTWCSPAC
jgi:Na+/H+ antiporter NhaA